MKRSCCSLLLVITPLWSFHSLLPACSPLKENTPELLITKMIAAVPQLHFTTRGRSLRLLLRLLLPVSMILAGSQLDEAVRQLCDLLLQLISCSSSSRRLSYSNKTGASCLLKLSVSSNVRSSCITLYKSLLIRRQPYILYVAYVKLFEMELSILCEINVFFSPGWFKAEGRGETSAAIPGDETRL